MKKFGVIVAGGIGQRMNSSVPKQFLFLKGKPLLWYTINAFLKSYDDLQIILVLPADHLVKGEKLKDLFNEKQRIQIICGGNTRFHSVQNGLSHVPNDSVVFIHDGVRCLVSENLIQRCYLQAIEKGSAIPAVAATDSVRIADDEKSVVADRSQIRFIQTPQTFRSELILPAFKQKYNDKFTDEATVVEASGKKIFLIEGEYTNIKITRSVDLLVAEKILLERDGAIKI